MGFNRTLNLQSAEENTNTEEIVRGTVKRVTYRNPQNGYSVLQLDVASAIGQQVTVVGNCVEARIGTNVVARGIFNNHPKFGRQFNATSITEVTPTTPDGMARYLASGLVKGIGEKTAERLVREFGAKTLEVIYQHPEKIAKIKGIGKRKAADICNALSEQQGMREIMQFLIENRISPGLANRIFQRYKNKAVEIITRDPYLLARDMRGIGFATADSIAMNLGLKLDSPQRLKAGIYYALEKALDDGHCYLPQLQLLDRARALLELDEGYDLQPYIESLCKDDYFVKVDETYFLHHIHKAEEFVARFIAERCAPIDKPIVDEEVVKRCLAHVEGELNVKFSVEQRDAVLDATRYPLLIITGGPGCGKTTIIRALSTLCEQTKRRLLLAAPTGRAAQRMAQVCSRPASTIHRLLRYDPTTGSFFYGVNQPLAADVVIIDEASMVDIVLARDLLSAIPHSATIILVGDKDQLPSVGPGRVFGDLVSLKEVRTVSLSQLFRRSEESSINSVAHMINAGLIPTIPEPDGVTKVDAYFLPRSDPEEAALTVEKLVSDQIPRKFNVLQEDISVLTPTNRGPLGTIALNKRLQDRINPSGSIDIEQQIVIGDIEFRVGDRVCQRVNNYQIDDAGVFNGDIGRIYSIDKKTSSLVVELWDGRLIRYSGGEIGQLTLAYAMSVHRSQGSEIPCVVLALHDSHYALLERQLIYTGVTRAKKLLIVVGSKRALAIASKRANTLRRFTMLKERILKQL